MCIVCRFVCLYSNYYGSGMSLAPEGHVVAREVEVGKSGAALIFKHNVLTHSYTVHKTFLAMHKSTCVVTPELLIV